MTPRPVWNPRPLRAARPGPPGRASDGAAEALPPAPPVDAEGRQRIAFGVQEAADALGVSRRHVEALIAGGELRSAKLGRRRLILAEDLRACLVALADRGRR